MEIEGGNGAPGPGPLVLSARDEDDRPVETLDESRGDDADDPAMPVLSGDDVSPPAALGLRPILYLRDCFAEDALLDGLAVAVQRLELSGEAVCLVRVL